MKASKKVLVMLLLLGLCLSDGKEGETQNEHEDKEPDLNDNKSKLESSEATDKKSTASEGKDNHIAAKKEATLDSIGSHLNILEQRLVSIEEKIDHVLFHHAHDVTPHEVRMTPMGPQIIPNIKNPNSAHHQMKMHDIVRTGFSNPYAYMGNMYGMGMGMMGPPMVF